MIRVGVGDPLSGISAKVTKENAVLVNSLSIPPLNDTLTVKPFRQFFTLNGDGITSSMLVDGSVTPQLFSIDAGNNDIYITTLSFVIVDAAASLNKFGNITALINGCKLEWQTLKETVTLADFLKSNWDFIRYCGGNPTIGATANSFRANNVLGSSEGYIPFKNLSLQIPPFGIKLRHSTLEKLVLTIRDNVTTIDQFDIIAEGFERIVE